MQTHADKNQENQSHSTAVKAGVEQKQDYTAAQFVDNRPEAIQKRKLQELANNSTRNQQFPQFQKAADVHPVKQEPPIQKKENRTGLPDNLKGGIENLSGYSMDDVKVHYNSDKPTQLQAHAYAQGTDIHIASGQEKHLSHEAWHVVQQKQGRVKPTMQMKGKVNVNDDVRLEKEADIMGTKSLQAGNEKNSPLQHKRTESRIAQRKKDDPNQAQKELSDLASEIQENKNDIEGVSPAMIDHAISALHEVASSDDKTAATKVFDKLKAVGKGQVENVPEAKNPEPVQKMSKTKEGLWIGIAIGTIIPVVGNIIGGLIGHAKGKQADLNDLMAAYPALTLGDLNTMTQAGAGTYRIRNQLNTINGNNIAHLIQLYNDGLAPETISNLLAIEQNGALIHNRYTTIVPNCIVGNIQFGSKSGGNFGSIYFPFGRIRLVHPGNPAIEPHGAGLLARATLNNADLQIIDNYWSVNVNVAHPINTPTDMYNHAQGLGSYQVAAPGVGGTLVEFYNNGWHPSRGTPKAFPAITQNELNIIAHIANLNNNAQLRAWMNAIPNLRRISMN